MKSNNQQKVNYRQVFGFIRDCSRGFYLAKTIFFLLPVFWAIDLSLSPFLLKLIVQAISMHGFEQASLFLKPVLIYFFWTAAVCLLTCFDSYVTFVPTIPQVRFNMAQKLYKKLLGMDQEFFGQNSSGVLVAKINDAVDELFILFRSISWGFLTTAFTLPIAIFALWQVDYLIAIALLAWTFLFSLGACIFAPRLSLLSGKLYEIRADNSGKIVDIFSNISTVRFFNAQLFECIRADEFYNDARMTERNMILNFLKLWLIYNWTYYSSLVFCLLRVFYLWNKGLSGPENFLFVFQINTALYSTLYHIIFYFIDFVRSSGKIYNGIQAILDYQPKVVDCNGAEHLKITGGKIEFKEVYFNYPRSSEPVFQNKTIIIQPGTKVGLVGPSGGGKTTFANLILRNFDPNKGSVLIDDQDIKFVTLDSLRESISVVTQESILFNRTVFDNIAYAKDCASKDEVLQAAKLARAHDFIISLEHGYETFVGERGGNLSGGQRQRISIARAILKNAPILILDEATSHLDSVLEDEINKGLEVLMQGKTVIAIAHRLSTIEKMDRILVIEKGKIVQDGSHSKLSSQKGVYRDLLAAQRFE